jgi:two-component sensor histidine kinase
MDRARRDTAEVRDRLVETARAAATGEENMLAAAEQVARALANLAAVRNAGPDCNRALFEARKGLSFFANIARLDARGHVVCAADTRAIGRDASDRPVWKRAIAGDGFALSERIVSPLTNHPVISGMLPLRTKGKLDGVIAVTIDVRWLDYMVNNSQLPHGAVVAIFDRTGTIVAANVPSVARAVFAHAPDLGLTDNTLKSAFDANGRAWTYATAPLLGRSVFAGFAMKQSSLFGPTYIHVGTDFILPFLMIALTWMAIWIATERQVTRWIIYLRRISAAYRSGHYAIRPALDGAPSEFRLLGAALADMADSIQERDKSLREALAQKTILIREVHHRVKNNLQIVMSLLNLQAGRLRDPAAQAALKQAQARINALALVHRTLHEIEDQSMVQIDRLLADLAQQTHEGFGGERRDLHIETDLVPRDVTGELAVPLALFTVEALTNVFKHAYRVRGGTIRLSLQPAGANRLRLAVEDDGAGFDLDESDANVGARLIRTFGEQVHGTAEMRSEKGKGTVVDIVFPDPAIATPQADRGGA